MKKTVVIGASSNPEKYSFKAVELLQKKGHEVVPVGIAQGNINGIEILTGQPNIDFVDTISLYVGQKNQPAYFDYIISLKPNRVIFNPGTENPEFYSILKENKIEFIEACTLVMLGVGNY
jgi:predicted CoA-binding protein